MNTKTFFARFITWASFVIVIGLIIWGLIAAEKKSSKGTELLPLPNEIVATDHILGSETASVTLVEYGDFQCPACASFHPIVKRILEETGSSTVRFVFRHFPLQQHANAFPSARAVEAANLQGKFWEMHDMIYENQSDWESISNAVPIFIGYAKTLNLDIVKFEADMKLPEIEKIISDGYKAGVKANIRATPTFFVNGKQIQNVGNYESFKKIIDDAAKPPTSS